MRFPLTLLAIACTTQLPAQALLVAGNVLRTASATYTRGASGFDRGELLQRFANHDMTGFGVEAAHPNMHVIHGIVVHMRDFGTSIPNGLVDITLYTEDPNRPAYPDLQNPLGGRTGVQPPIVVLTYLQVPFSTPILAPQGRDLFVGIRVPAFTDQFGGVRLALITSSTTASLHDRAGPGMPTSPPEANSYRLFRNLNTDAMHYEARGQYQIDLLTRSPSGFAATITNQGSYPISNHPPGVSTLLSGLHPDAASPPLHAGRADRVSFFYHDFVLPVGSPVFFLAAFANFGPIVPLANYAAGSVGGHCLDQTQSFVLGFAPTNASFECWHTTNIPNPVRPLLRGISWSQQAIGLDPASGAMRGTQCVMQHF
jgi:hypothetical protein